MALRVCQQWLRFMGRGYDVALTGGPHAEPPVAVAQALADIRISAALELTTAGGEGCVNDWSN
jgi:hypothetical protein